MDIWFNCMLHRSGSKSESLLVKREEERTRFLTPGVGYLTTFFVSVKLVALPN